MYPKPSDTDLIRHIYGPLNYKIPALFLKLFAPEDASNITLLRLSRYPSFVAFVLTLAAVGGFVWLATRSVLWAAVGVSLCCFYQSALFGDLFKNRVEQSSLFAMTLALVFYLSRMPYRAVVATVLASSLMLFKLNYLGFGLLLIGYFWWSSTGPQTRKSILVTTAISLAVLTLYSTTTSGGGYWYHVGSMVGNPFDSGAPWRWLAVLFRYHLGYSLIPLLATALLALAHDTLRPFSVMSLSALALSLLFSAKYGADLNYFYHGSLLLLLNFVVVAHSVSHRGAWSWLVLGSLLVSFNMPLSRMPIHGMVWQQACINRSYPRPGCPADSVVLREAAGKYVPLVSDESKTYLILYNDLAIRVGEPVILDQEVVTLQVLAGEISLAFLYRKIQEREFDRIVIHRSYAQYPFVKALKSVADESRYRPVVNDGDVLVLDRPY